MHCLCCSLFGLAQLLSQLNYAETPKPQPVLKIECQLRQDESLFRFVKNKIWYIASSREEAPADDASRTDMIMMAGEIDLLFACLLSCRLATVRSSPDRGLFWRPFKKTGPYGPAPSDCSLVPKILDQTVRSGLFII
jgi:hypothetical protein